MLIHGDNLIALQALQQDFAGKIKCIYIDPPFNTGQAFENYDDNLEMSIWLGLMRDRVQLLHSLLCDEGTMFVHIDDSNLPYMMVLLDEIFGRENRHLITFKQGAATGHKAINPGCVTTTNYIIMVAKNKGLWQPNRVYTKRGRDPRCGKYITNIEACYQEWNIITLTEAYAKSENDDVIRWIKPPLNQLGLFWQAGQQYNPDFLVETREGKFMVEVKASNETTNDDVVLKARAGIKWCHFASAADPDGKPWEYRLITDSNIKLGNTCKYTLGTAHKIKEG